MLDYNFPIRQCTSPGVKKQISVQFVTGVGGKFLEKTVEEAVVEKCVKNEGLLFLRM